MIPVYKKIIDSIQSQISQGVFGERAKLPSESQLMAQFSTSRITVIRALKELEFTGIIYREKGRGSFVAPVKEQKQRIISLIIPHKTDFFSGGQQYVRSVYKYCQKHGYLCSVHYSEQSSKRERKILEDISKHKVSGIILYPINSKNIDLISTLIIEGCPLVLLDRKLDEVEVPVVESDNYTGAFEAVNYILDNGHREIAFVGAKDSRTVSKRYKGYCNALIARGISLNKNIIFTSYHEKITDDKQKILTLSEAEWILNQLHSVTPRVTAVFCANDLIAVRLIKAARLQGLEIPEDLSFVGFDNISYNEIEELDLSSVEQNFDQIGKSCVEILYKKISGDNTTPSSITIPTRLNKGNSVAAAKNQLNKNNSR